MTLLEVLKRRDETPEQLAETYHANRQLMATLVHELGAEGGRVIMPQDVVQLDPEKIGNKAFAGCFLVVTEVKPWGVMGFVQALGDTRDGPGGQAYLRVKWGEFVYIGRAEWSVE